MVYFHSYNIVTALKGAHIKFYLLLLQLVLFRVEALKSHPVHHSIMQIIFFFWFFGIREGILGNQNLLIGLDSFS